MTSENHRHYRLIKKFKIVVCTYSTLSIMDFSIVESHNFNGEKLCNGKMLPHVTLKMGREQHHKDIRGHYKNYLCAILKSDEKKNVLSLHWKRLRQIVFYYFKKCGFIFSSAEPHKTPCSQFRKILQCCNKLQLN